MNQQDQDLSPIKLTQDNEKIGILSGKETKKSSTNSEHIVINEKQFLSLVS